MKMRCLKQHGTPIPNNFRSPDLLMTPVVNTLLRGLTGRSELIEHRAAFPDSQAGRRCNEVSVVGAERHRMDAAVSIVER